ncbi:MAG: DUF4160 domain-containing protein [Longimicrobiales bacterium]
MDGGRGTNVRCSLHNCSRPREWQVTYTSKDTACRSVSGAELDKRYHGRYRLDGQVRRGGYIFVAWTGDHGPRHVHVYRDGQLVLKWDLENGKSMCGRATRRILKLIDQLREEGLL